MNSISEKAAFLAPAIKASVNPEKYLQERYLEALEEVPLLHGENPAEARIREVSYLTLTRFMPTLLDRKDRMSMACGLEVRVPFSDHRLFEYVWNIPSAMKNCDGIEKGILRRAFSDLLPPEVLTRRKSPYPKTHNPLYREAVKSRLMDILNDSESPLQWLCNTKSLRKLLTNNNPIFPVPWFGQLMGDDQYMGYLIQLNSWFKNYQVVLK